MTPAPLPPRSAVVAGYASALALSLVIWTAIIAAAVSWVT